MRSLLLFTSMWNWRPIVSKITDSYHCKLCRVRTESFTGVAAVTRGGSKCQFSAFLTWLRFLLVSLWTAFQQMWALCAVTPSTLYLALLWWSTSRSCSLLQKGLTSHRKMSFKSIDWGIGHLARYRDQTLVSLTGSREINIGELANTAVAKSNPIHVSVSPSNASPSLIKPPTYLALIRWQLEDLSVPRKWHWSLRLVFLAL